MPITWGYVKQWAEANGVTEDAVMCNTDGDEATDLDKDGENGTTYFVLSFAGDA